jgi:hypothetical protein
MRGARDAAKGYGKPDQGIWKKVKENQRTGCQRRVKENWTISRCLTWEWEAGFFKKAFPLLIPKNKPKRVAEND